MPDGCKGPYGPITSTSNSAKRKLLRSSAPAHPTNDERRAHLTDLKREHLIYQVCIQEIACRNVRTVPQCRGISEILPKYHRVASKMLISDTKSSYPVLIGNAAEAFGLRPRCGSGLVGTSMKSAIAAHLPDEHFVIRVDRRVKSHHRRFLDALREGLQLRDQFPQHDVKVESMQADGRQRAALH